MSLAQQNVRAAAINVRVFHQAAKDERNAVLRKYYLRIDKDTREALTYRHGTQIYRNKSFNQFLKLINPRPIYHPIWYLGGADPQLMADAANWMSNQVYAKAMSIRDTGQHLFSLQLFLTAVNAARWAAIDGRVTRSLPERPLISIVALTAYASTLEANEAGGILYHVAKKMRKRYRDRLAVKYDYVSGKTLGTGGGTFPRITIGHPKDLKAGLQTPGKYRKGSKNRSRYRGRRRRYGARGYAQVKGREA